MLTEYSKIDRIVTDQGMTNVSHCESELTGYVRVLPFADIGNHVPTVPVYQSVHQYVILPVIQMI